MRSDAVPWTIRGIELALGVLIVYGLVQLGLAAGNLLLLLFVAILLPSALEPVGTLRDRLPLGRGATLLVVYATFLVGMVGMAFIVVPAAIDQGGKTPVAGRPSRPGSGRHSSHPTRMRPMPMNRVCLTPPRRRA